MMEEPRIGRGEGLSGESTDSETVRLRDEEAAPTDTKSQRRTSPQHRDTATPHHAFAAIALGANLGDRVGQLRAAVTALDAHPAVAVTGRSPVYEAAAHTLDGAPQPPYLNAVVTATTTLDPEALLDVLLAVEREAGRTREHRWAPRTLDLDLVLYDDLYLDTARLTVPHPRLAIRRFVLQPLADLVPDRVVPRWNATVADLLAACPDRAPLRRTDLRLCDEEPGRIRGEG